MICPHCGQVHLVKKQGKVVTITVKERAELHSKSKLTKMEQLIKDKALLKIELRDKKERIEELEKENAKLIRKIERLEGKENVFQRLLRIGIDDRIRGFLVTAVHTHIKRCISLVGKAALGRVKLIGGNTKVKQHAVDGVDPKIVKHVRDL